MSDKLFKTLAYVGGAAAIYSGMKKKKKAERNRVIAQQAALRAQQQAFSSTSNNTQQGPNQTSNSNPSQGAGSQTGATVNSTITGSGSYQMTADTNASLPILYGQCQVRGAVVGSELEGIGNTLLRTGLVIAETTGEYPTVGDYKLNKVFWNDADLTVMGNGSVRGATLSDGTNTTKYDGKIFIYLYQGDFYTPFSNIMGNSADYSSAIKPGIPKWYNNSADYYGRGALWAFVDQYYDAEAGIQGLGTFTFDITNLEYSNPANVVYDYLTTGRYGHGYPTSSVDSGSFFSGSNSLRNISDQLRFFSSEDVNDDANVDIGNSTLAPQFVVTGNAFGSYTIGTSDVLGTVSANTGNVGKTTSTNEVPVVSADYNRLKILWGKSGNATSTGSGNIANCNVTLSSNNTFTAFLDVARLIPDGVGHTETNADTAVVNGEILPGVDYNYGDSTGTVDVLGSGVSPVQIPNFLLEGDKIRPEGSPYIYTVAETVDVPRPGYATFEIPVKERIAHLDIANTTLANLTVNTPGANSGVYSTLTSGPDIKGIYQFGTFPYIGGTGPNHDVIPDMLFSNVLVGNTVISSPQEDTIYLGQEKKASINGLLSTEGDVQSNLKTLLQHSDATLTWALPEGEWKAIPNANVDTSSAFVFDDDNIIGEIRVTTADIGNFYNSARASYVEKTHNSVKEEAIIYTPISQQAANETRHMLEMNYPLCSSGMEATRKIEQELIQNRLDMTVEFTADYSAIIVEPGDVVKVTNADYGFDNKLFRVLRKIQDMDGDILVNKFSLLEWDLAIFKERIPFKKPALDDIEFDPEQYEDVTDGGNLKDDSVPGSSIVDGDITGTEIGSNTVTSTNLTTTGVTSGTYDPSIIDGLLSIPNFLVDAAGRLTDAGTTNINLGGTATQIGGYLGNVTMTNNATVSLSTQKYALSNADVGNWVLMGEGHMDYEYTGPTVTSGVLATRLTYEIDVNYEGGYTRSFSFDHFDGAFTTIPIHQHMSMNWEVEEYFPSNTQAYPANVEITAKCFISTTQSYNTSNIFTFDSGFLALKTRNTI